MRHNFWEYNRRTLTRPALFLVILGCMTAIGCKSKTPWSREAFKRHVNDAVFYSEIATNEIERRRGSATGSFIHIPETTISMPRLDELVGQHETVFQIDVYIEPPETLAGIPMQTLLRDHLRIDVLGASDATIRIAEYNTGAKDRPDPWVSGNLIQVRIRPEDIEHSLTIVAQFPEKADQWERDIRLPQLEVNAKNVSAKLSNTQKVGTEKEEDAHDDLKQALKDYTNAARLNNPYRQIREVPVYNGDLITQVYMLSYDEVSDAFGTNFAKYFHVGKAYFKNRHPDKKLIVNTTSLRAKCLFFRPPNPYLPAGKNRTLLPRNPFSQKSFQSVEIENDLNRLAAGQIKNEYLQHSFYNLSYGTRETILTEALSRINQNNLYDAAENIWASYSVHDKNISNEYSFYQDILGYQSDNSTSTLNDQIYALADSYQTVALRQFTYSIATGYLNAVRRFERESEQGIVPDPINKTAIMKTASTAALEFHPKDRSTFKDGRMESVGPTRKHLAVSDDMVFQRALASTGYVFEDFYRPMTFEAVLISLIKKTEQNEWNRALDILESIGVVSGALVGVEALAGEFATDSFAQAVAVTTGVLLPELRKLLMEDIEEYLPNLATMGLGTQFTIGPNESRDGYVFFPKGAIFGYGVDEFSLDTPSWLVNIDNSNVAVDATLVDRGFEFSSGIQDPDDQVSGALNTIRTQRQRRQEELAEIQTRLISLLGQEIQDKIEDSLDDGKPESAAKQLAEFEKTAVGQNSPALIETLKAQINAARSSENIVLLDLQAGKDPLGNTLFLSGPTVNGANNEWKATYRARLSGEMTTGSSALMSIQPILDRSLKEMSITLTAKETMNNKTTSLKKPAIGLNFDDAAANQKWHDPQTIEITLSAPASIKLKEISKYEARIRHRLISADGLFDSERVLWLRFPDE